MDRFDELCRMYDRVPHQRGPVWRYSRRELRIFPRYNVVEAMLVEVERLDPDQLPDVRTLAAALDRAAWVGQSLLTDPPGGELQAEVMQDERRLFSEAVEAWMAIADLAVEPLGYRRVLTPEESSDWRMRLERRWGTQGTCWHPMLTGAAPADVLVLTAAAMDSRTGIARVRKALQVMGRTRVTELREYGADYVLDLELFDPRYNFAEGLWTDDSLDWVVFASHEATVAFGGLIATVLPSVWKNLGDWRWSGW
jgi:hypothetical protein